MRHRTHLVHCGLPPANAEAGLKPWIEPMSTLSRATN
jgi:predicted TIM-barrel fold metal-dependent hydrolase